MSVQKLSFQVQALKLSEFTGCFHQIFLSKLSIGTFLLGISDTHQYPTSSLTFNSDLHANEKL